MLFRSQTSAIIFNSSVPIRFEKAWLSQEGFIDLVIDWWQSFTLGDNLGKDWQLKLQFLRKKLRGWHANVMGAMKRQKQHLLSQISRFEELDESHFLSAHDIDSWQACQSSLHQIYLDEETYWQQQSRIQWFLQGDLNTKFFHVTASSRKRRNIIFSLEIDGTTCFDLVQLKKHVTAYYKSLLGTTTERDLSLNPNLWPDSERLSVSQSISLEAPFSLEEIKKTLFSCNPNKAPGPDGLSFLFYQTVTFRNFKT